MIDRGANKRQPPSRIHGVAPIEELRGDGRLIVDHRDDARVALILCAAECGLSRERAFKRDLAADLLKRWSDHSPLFITKEPALARVRVHACDGDRAVDTETL